VELKISIPGLEKLIEVVAQGVGALAKPWMIRRLAPAEADRIRILADAHIGVADRLRLPEGAESLEGKTAERPPELRLLGSGLKSGDLSATSEVFERRVEQRQMEQESRRQRNLEAIALGAAESIRDEVSQEPVDEDWVVRFFENAQDVSNPKIQRLWSAILAREVAAPRTTSMRTLEVLRNISSQEADLFQECLRYICQNDDELLFIPVRDIPPWRNRHVLEDCGMFATMEMISIRPGQSFECSHGGVRLRFSVRADKSSLDMPWRVSTIRLSVAGKSIADLSWRPGDPSVDLLGGIIESYEGTFDIEGRYDNRTASLQEFVRGALATPE
jgi:hypothetical protein